MELRVFARGAVTLGLSLALAAGAALAVGGQAAQADEAQAVPATVPADFTDRDTGLYPDINSNDRFQNSGNRGCNACHADLFAVDKDNGTYTHITTYAGLKNGTYLGDCIECHSSPTAMAGIIMGDPIHTVHYSSPAFIAVNGNCWSCHATTWGADGEPVFVLFEQLQYEASYGGYPDAATDGTIAWAMQRGFDTGHYTGISMDENPQVQITLNQEPSLEEDEFIILNFELADGEDGYDRLAADYDNWALEITGVNNPGSLTLADLKALPAYEFTAAQWCLVAGINSAMVDNMPMKGVLLADVIDAMGGLAEGVNAYAPVCADGWTSGAGFAIDELIACNAVLVYENYGHDLTIEQGGPIKIFIPGTGGAVSAKNLLGINFVELETPATFGVDFAAVLGSGMGLHINSSWFDNDGVQATVGEVLTLEGAAYGWDANEFDFTPAQIQFSFDYGRTWITVDVPEEFDDDQWMRFQLDWTPQAAGTYILKMKAVDANGMEQASISNLIVTVNEAQ